MAEKLIIFEWLILAILAGVLTYGLIAIVINWLRRTIIAQVTPRSSHAVETPEGAGIVVVPVVLATTAIATKMAGLPTPYGSFYGVVVVVSALILAVLGFVDDARGLPVSFRLIVQSLLVSAVVFLLPESARIFPPAFPFILERSLIVLGGVWFVNLFNFMDGIDLISVVETVMLALGIMLLAWLDVIPHFYGWIAAALFGAILGFAPWNAPPARLFLGDSGSIAIGFLFGIMLLHAAVFAGIAFAPAAILPLYYLADATITLLRRCWRGNQFWRAHREHFYQKATLNGFTVRQIIWRIVCVDIILMIFAVASAYTDKLGATGIFFVALLVVGFTLRTFATGKQLCSDTVAKSRPFEGG